jgi:pimeloyl-ACP methyl ester carboxylesterase
MSPTPRTAGRATAPTTPRIQGKLLGGMPYLSFGTGTPLVVLPGITANHEPPAGTNRRFQAQQLLPFADQHRVWWLNRRPGLAANASMADLARDYADALRLQFAGPVDVLGISTGGSVALQLAADHPDVVQRLVIVSAAYRLAPRGIRAQRRLADGVKESRPRLAAAALFGMLGATPATRGLFSALGWMRGRAMLGKATPDLLATIHAEDGFNLRDRLGEISAPTLVVGGDQDAFYSAELFRETAARIPNGRLILYPGRGHAGASNDPRLVADVLAFLDGRPAAAERQRERMRRAAERLVARTRQE